MKQNKYAYLLSYQNLMTPWVKRAKISFIPADELFVLASVFLEKNEINWNNLLINGKNFQDSSHLLKKHEKSIEILSEFIILYWFHHAEISWVDSDLQDEWLNWQMKKLRAQNNSNKKNKFSYFLQIFKLT